MTLVKNKTTPAQKNLSRWIKNNAPTIPINTKNVIYPINTPTSMDENEKAATKKVITGARACGKYIMLNIAHETMTNVTLTMTHTARAVWNGSSASGDSSTNVVGGFHTIMVKL